MLRLYRIYMGNIQKTDIPLLQPEHRPLFIFLHRQKPNIEYNAHRSHHLSQYQPQRIIDIEGIQHAVEGKQQTAAESAYALPSVKCLAAGSDYPPGTYPAGKIKHTNNNNKNSQAQINNKCNIIFHNHRDLIKHNLTFPNIVKKNIYKHLRELFI